MADMVYMLHQTRQTDVHHPGPHWWSQAPGVTTVHRRPRGDTHYESLLLSLLIIYFTSLGLGVWVGFNRVLALHQ